MDLPWLDILNATANLSIALGLFITMWQIKLQVQQAVTDFEDDLDREYREISLALPIEALLGETLSPEAHAKALEQFHRYFDLTNQVIFLRQTGRLSDLRWETWLDEIRVNLDKPAFKAAWDEIRRRAPGEFILLRRLESTAFDTDPRDW
ncbi:MAG: hypothetical protein ACK4PI_12620 [Tepidisphaerales bacterium]